MGKKYSINSNGLIVAERDIYSLGGFIPKGKTGGKIANENQLSQDGECWLYTGDISGTPNIVLRDNAFLFQGWYPASPPNTYAVISGNTRILSTLFIDRNQDTGGKYLYIHDSKINTVFAAAFFGPADPNKACEQGGYEPTAQAGTAVSDMKFTNTKVCRTLNVTHINEETRICAIPSLTVVRVLYTYIGADGVERYSGVYKEFSGVATADLYHPVYSRCFINIYSAVLNMTPDQLLAKKIVLENQSVIRQTYLVNNAFYTDSSIVNSNIYINETVAVQSLRVYVAGGFHDCKKVTFREITQHEYRLAHGIFSNIGDLVFDPIMATTESLGAGNYFSIRAYDCPLLCIDGTTYSGIPLTEDNGLVLRNCIVPKAQFINNPIEGNTYEGIDFSYAQKDLGQQGNYNFKSSHFQGMYDVHVESLPYTRVARVSGQHNLNVTSTIVRPKRNIIGSLTEYDYTSIPHIEGSSYVVGGTSVYGDVKMVGSEYKYLVMGENMFERGSINDTKGLLYKDTLIPETSGNPRLIGTGLIPLKAGDRIECADGYFFLLTGFDKNGVSLGSYGWAQGLNVTDSNVRYGAILLKKGSASTVSGDYISLLDIKEANVRIAYAYEKKYYVTNVSDIPSDGMGGRDENYKLLGLSDWEQGDVSNADVNYGKTYDQIKSIATNPNYVRTKGLFNIPNTPNISEKPLTGFVRTKVLFDAFERYEPINAINALMAFVLRKDPSAPITPSDASNAHLVIGYVPTPRIIASYQENTFEVEGKIRMYDNSVLYGGIKNDNEKAIILTGDAVFSASVNCVCAWADGNTNVNF